jgi:hypothetical protein
LNWTKKCPTVTGFTINEKEVEYYKEYYVKGGTDGRLGGKQKVCHIGDKTVLLEYLDCLAPMTWVRDKVVTAYSDVLADNAYVFFLKRTNSCQEQLFSILSSTPYWWNIGIELVFTTMLTTTRRVEEWQRSVSWVEAPGRSK